MSEEQVACPSCGGAWHGRSPCTEYTGPHYTIPGGELCTICGLRYYNKSMGGPGVCPACDTGYTGATLVKAQKDEIRRLRSALEQLLSAVNGMEWDALADQASGRLDDARSIAGQALRGAVETGEKHG